MDAVPALMNLGHPIHWIQPSRTHKCVHLDMDALPMVENALLVVMDADAVHPQMQAIP